MLGDKAFMTGSAVTVADLKVYETFRKLKIYCADPQIASDPFQVGPRGVAIALPSQWNTI